ncbi:MAG TPA: response regulator transcription factor [Dehalococcoidia bacterium]|nr:response regulator transcription factor [Dehalococcoidia bacterium]
MLNGDASDSAGTAILVVDDDLRTRQAIQWALEDEGFVVDTAADGRQGLERAAKSCPALVVLDMMLPIVDGAAVADGLRAIHGKPPPIVLVTADDRPEEKARRVGAYAYLRKPFDLDDLIATVRRGLLEPRS